MKKSNVLYCRHRFWRTRWHKLDFKVGCVFLGLTEQDKVKVEGKRRQLPCPPELGSRFARVW